jgi:hypothetical protein
MPLAYRPRHGGERHFELKRVGCFNEGVNGEFDDATKAAWHRFNKLTSISMPDDLSPDTIKAVRGINKRICPVACPRGSHADGELCVADAPPPKSVPPKSAPPKSVTTRNRGDNPDQARARTPTEPCTFSSYPHNCGIAGF